MKLYFPFFLLICLNCSLFSQSITTGFTLPIPGKKVQNSIYNKIVFVDSRFDTTDMGTVLTGNMNKKTKVVFKTPFAVQLANMLSAITDETAGGGELLFQLRQLQFAEQAWDVNERGYYKIKAILYEKKAAGYQPAGSLDTTVEKRTSDVTQPLFTNAGDMIADFIASHLTQKKSPSASLSFDEVVHIDSLEKSLMPLYTASVLTDGYYLTYQSLKNMKPDGVIGIEMKNDKISSVKTTGKKSGLTRVLYPADVYAIVYKGQPYISTDYGFCPLQKLDNDFIFTAKPIVMAATSKGREMVNFFFFGSARPLGDPNNNAVWEIKLDHINGDFVRIKRVDRNKE